MCPQCHARNSPTAFACHNCEAELSREPQAPHSASTWRTPARVGGAAVAGCLLLLASARGGEWIGDWLRRNPPAPKLEARVAPAADSSVLEARYEAWKQAHALPTEDLMALYAPDARIIFTGGMQGTLDDLRQLAQQVRQSRSFDHVSDIGRVHISPNGARAIITARHRYNHSSLRQPSYGNRVLRWEMRDGVWLVVEDRFPSSFSTSPDQMP